MNTRRPPYDDVRVRKALALLYNREEIIAKLMYGAYSPIDSNYPGSMWENPGNEKIRYDPQQALRLLAEAGFNSRDTQGRLARNGSPLILDLIYPSQSSERSLTVYQEDLRKVGITLNLRLVSYETMIKLIDDQQFGMVSAGYTADLFPNPESSLSSKIADSKSSFNLTGFKNARVDQLIAQYNAEYSIPERKKLLQEIDKISTDSHDWIFEWYAPYERIAYWNRFGMPKGNSPVLAITWTCFRYGGLIPPKPQNWSKPGAILQSISARGKWKTSIGWILTRPKIASTNPPNST